MAPRRSASSCSSCISPTFALAAVLVAVVPACGRHRDDADAAGVTNVTSAPLTIPREDARSIEQLVRAECRRDTTCDAHGGSHAYEECARALRIALRIELDEATMCPYGIAPTPLEECLAAIESEPCSPDTRTIRRLEACRASTLCPPPS